MSTIPNKILHPQGPEQPKQEVNVSDAAKNRMNEADKLQREQVGHLQKVIDEIPSIKSEIAAKEEELSTARGWLKHWMDPANGNNPQKVNEWGNKVQEIERSLKTIKDDLTRKQDQKDRLEQMLTNVEYLVSDMPNFKQPDEKTNYLVKNLHHIVWYKSADPADPYEYSSPFDPAHPVVDRRILREKSKDKDEYLYWHQAREGGRVRVLLPGQEPPPSEEPQTNMFGEKFKEDKQGNALPFDPDDPVAVAKAQELFMQKRKEEVLVQQERAKKLTVRGLMEMEKEEDRRNAMEDILSLPDDNIQKQMLMTIHFGRPKNEKGLIVQKEFVRLLDKKKIPIPVRKIEDIEKDVVDMEFGWSKISAKDFIRNTFELERMNFYMFWVEKIMDTTGGYLLAWDIYKEKIKSKNEETHAVGSIIRICLLRKANELDAEATEVLRKKMNEERDPLLKKDLQEIVAICDKTFGRKKLGPVFDENPQPVDAVGNIAGFNLFGNMPPQNAIRKLDDIEKIFNVLEKDGDIDIPADAQALFNEVRKGFIAENLKAIDRIALDVKVIGLPKLQAEENIPDAVLQKKITVAIEDAFKGIRFENGMMASAASDEPTEFDRQLLQRRLTQSLGIHAGVDAVTAKRWATILSNDKQLAEAMHMVVIHKVLVRLGTDDKEVFDIVTTHSSYSANHTTTPHVLDVPQTVQEAAKVAASAAVISAVLPNDKKIPPAEKQPEKEKQEASPALKSHMENVSTVKEGNVEYSQGSVEGYSVLIVESDTSTNAYLTTDTGEQIPLSAPTIRGLNSVILKRADEDVIFLHLEKQDIEDPYNKKKDDLLENIFGIDQNNKVIHKEEIAYVSDGMHLLFRGASEVIGDTHPLRALGIITSDDKIDQKRAAEFQELFRYHMTDIRDWTFADMLALTKIWDQEKKFRFAPLIELRKQL